MTREEEIQKRIDEETGIDNYGSFDYQIGVCDGVRLADKTMIEKVCDWLDNVNTDTYMDSGIFQMSELIQDLKRIIENEL